MIPSFSKEGFLPIGVHLASLNEFETRFAYTTWRRDLFQYLQKLIKDLRIISCKTIYVDGSYVTIKRLPMI